MTVSPVLLSNLGGALDEQFAAQFADHHAGGPPVSLLLTLSPALHHQCLVDTVAEIGAVRGVAFARWIRSSPAGEALLGDGVRAVLGGFTIKTTTAVGDKPLVCLLHAETGHVLVLAHPARGPEGGFDQDTLHLAEVVDQALRYHAEAGGHEDLPSVPEHEAGLRCDTCQHLIGVGEDPDALDCGIGAVCGYANLRTGVACAGLLRPVSVLVTARGAR